MLRRAFPLALIAHNPCCGAGPRRLEGARRRKPWCVCPRRRVHSQVRHGGKGFPCGRRAWRDLLGSLSHGVYAVEATFTLMKPSAKVTDYGLVFGAADVEGAAPTYVYFTIAQDGTFQAPACG